MKYYYYIVLCLSLVLFFSSSPLTNAVDIVPDTCMKISKSEPNINYDFCVTALGSDPRSSTASVGELAVISFHLSVSKAKSISLAITKFLKNPKFDPFQKGALESCQELYSDAPDDLEAGLKALKGRDYETANVEVSGAITYADTCEDGFRERREFSPLSRENSDFMELAAISLAFTVPKLWNI